MNVPYHIVVRPIDEKNLGDRTSDPPDELVLTLGLAKAKHLLQEINSGFRWGQGDWKSNN